MSQATTAESPARIVSIDAAPGGFDMFWIIGGDAFVREILKLGGWSFSSAISRQFEHVEWEGFRFYDLIFPLFLFLVGCVLPYSLEKYSAQPAQAYWRIARRTALLVLLGLLANNLLKFDWSNLRVAGVLQRIGICYGIAALIYLRTSIRGQAIATTAILLGYWCLLALTPVPGGTAGDYSKSGNLSGHVDRQILPGKIFEEYYGYGDNEGILSTIPAVATILLGVLAGHWVRSNVAGTSKVAGLVVAGLFSLAIGYAWGNVFPIIKNIWTSSFVMVAAGWSSLLLAVFYLWLDVFHCRRGALSFIVIGVNAITIYFAQRFINFREISQFFLVGIVSLSGSYGRLVTLIGILVAKWLFLWMLYRQKLFLRV